MKLFEIIKPHPFPNSVEQRVLYHGTSASFDKFKRATHGIYVTPYRSWAESHYGDRIVSLYANITKIYHPTYEESELFYMMEYDKVSKLLDSLSPDYNCVLFGGESDSMVLFGDIDIVNAETGKRM